MEILALFGTPEQKDRWLVPLLEGEIRSCFAMTEPDVASSDARNIQLSIRREGDEYVLNGRKWWISGAANPRCKVAIVMGKTDPDAPTYSQQSMVLVPMDTPGLTVVRDLLVFGYNDREGHCELNFDNVRVPVANILGEEGSGFALAQARLGPGRIHHCMRCIGMAERALELMCRRVTSRVAFGKPLAQQGVIQEWIADSRIEIEQARLLTMKAAWLMDTVGNKGARIEISAIKVVAPNVALKVVDRAIQAHGGGGVSQDFPLAGMYAGLRTLRFADGPDEVHRMQLARRELAPYLETGSDGPTSADIGVAR
jgi:acyl-CoA dehydrogenase